LGVFIWITSDIILENVNQCPDSRALRISSRKFLCFESGTFVSDTSLGLRLYYHLNDWTSEQ
jgi:hypothetical protein